MDYQQSAVFTRIDGTIVDVVPEREQGGEIRGCDLFFALEDDNGNLATFLVTKDTYVVDGITLKEGMKAAFWYRTDAPVPLIYPPRYRAVAAATQGNERMVDVSFYDAALVNAEHNLMLNLDKSTLLRTVNHQLFLGNPANHNLVVTYTTSTRSIPAQTTPLQVVVLCGEEEQGF